MTNYENQWDHGSRSSSREGYSRERGQEDDYDRDYSHRGQGLHSGQRSHREYESQGRQGGYGQDSHRSHDSDRDSYNRPSDRRNDYDYDNRSHPRGGQGSHSQYRGFASMDPEERRERARREGIISHDWGHNQEGEQHYGSGREDERDRDGRYRSGQQSRGRYRSGDGHYDYEHEDRGFRSSRDEDYEGDGHYGGGQRSRSSHEEDEDSDYQSEDHGEDHERRRISRSKQGSREEQQSRRANPQSASRSIQGTQRTGSGRGFASMDKEELRRIASKGGRMAHQSGNAHEFTSEEARAIARRRGQRAATR